MVINRLTTPLSTETIKALRAGENILLSGELYTARDAAHKRLTEMLSNNQPLPIPLQDRAVYYAGPCPARPGRVIGSVGPTTSSRMDAYAPKLIAEGLRVMIGKGERSKEVIQAIQEYCGVYFAAVGGAAASLSLCVQRAEPVAFEDLGTEAIYKLTVCDMPLTVAVDCTGGNIYKRGD